MSSGVLREEFVGGGKEGEGRRIEGYVREGDDE